MTSYLKTPAVVALKIAVPLKVLISESFRPIIR